MPEEAISPDRMIAVTDVVFGVIVTVIVLAAARVARAAGILGALADHQQLCGELPFCRPYLIEQPSPHPFRRSAGWPHTRRCPGQRNTHVVDGYRNFWCAPRILIKLGSTCRPFRAVMAGRTLKWESFL